VAEAFAIAPRGPFALRRARDFLAAFGPAGQAVGPDPDALLLAFAVDGADEVAAVRVTQPDGAVHGELLTPAAEPARVARQVARLLSLDRDATGFAALGARDPVLGRLQAEQAGLRPVLFSSPYEAAAWSVVSARVQVAQAVRLRARLVEAAACAVQARGARLHPFPPPARLLAADVEAVLPAVKAARVRAVAEAALRGELDPERLLALEPAEALEDLRRHPGLGPFYAALVLIRGAGGPDVLPAGEPRVRRAAARAYAEPALAEPEAFTAHAERWRPWRGWAGFLLRASGA
jgi:DNA-3-methyladenine glycosylase II